MNGYRNSELALLDGSGRGLIHGLQVEGQRPTACPKSSVGTPFCGHCGATVANRRRLDAPAEQHPEVRAALRTSWPFSAPFRAKAAPTGGLVG
jgi:hypothetical protein